MIKTYTIINGRKGVCQKKAGNLLEIDRTDLEKDHWIAAQCNCNETGKAESDKIRAEKHLEAIISA